MDNSIDDFEYYVDPKILERGRELFEKRYW